MATPAIVARRRKSGCETTSSQRIVIAARELGRPCSSDHLVRLHDQRWRELGARSGAASKRLEIRAAQADEKRTPVRVDAKLAEARARPARGLAFGKRPRVADEHPVAV